MKTYFGVVLDGVGKVLDVVAISERNLDLIFREAGPKVTAGASIDVVDADDVVPGF